jgi:hypothetical protein
MSDVDNNSFSLRKKGEKTKGERGESRWMLRGSSQIKTLFSLLRIFLFFFSSL